MSIVIICDAGYGGAGRTYPSRASPIDSIAGGSAYRRPVKCDLLITNGSRYVRGRRESSIVILEDEVESEVLELLDASSFSPQGMMVRLKHKIRKFLLIFSYFVSPK